MAEADDKLICWIDTETTGLHADQGLLLEVAMVITTSDMRTIAGMNIVIQQPRQEAFALSSDYVRGMHESSGLYSELETGTPIQAAENMLIEMVDRISREFSGLLPVVAGNSIGFDRKWLESHMPTLNESHLHYRNIDVSSIKELARRFAPEVYAQAPQKKLGHRAMDDIYESIAELKHYVGSGLFAEPRM